MKTKSVGLGLILCLLVLSFFSVASVQALPSPPTDDEFKDEAIAYMIDHHPELGAVDSDEWKFTLIGFTTSRFKLKLTFADEPDEPPTYDLDWMGLITWNAYTDQTRITELYFNYEVALTVEKVGPGTTNPSPGVYLVKGGEEYSFTAKEAESDNPDEYYFRFDHWSISDGETTTTSLEEELRGTATTDLTITAVFTTEYMSYCSMIYEDGLNMGYLWRDDHALLVIKPEGPSKITVNVITKTDIYLRTFSTINTRSLCIYMSPNWFSGSYSLEILATNSAGPYSPSYQLAGVD